MVRSCSRWAIRKALEGHHQKRRRVPATTFISATRRIRTCNQGIQAHAERTETEPAKSLERPGL